MSMKFNPVFWIMWLLPGATVVAGLSTLAIALDGADRPLPATYHWEGERLDADFARARHAAERGIAVSFSVRRGECVAAVRNAPADSDVLDLELANGAETALDRRLELRRTLAGDFRATCAALPSGSWWISLRDPGSDWSVRGRIAGELVDIELHARDPGAQVP